MSFFFCTEVFFFDRYFTDEICFEKIFDRYVFTGFTLILVEVVGIEIIIASKFLRESAGND